VEENRQNAQLISFNSGLNLDSDEQIVNDTSYRYARNLRLVSVAGNTGVLQPIAGTRLVLEVKPGFEIIGYATTETVLFLFSTDPVTGVSEIGCFNNKTFYNLFVYEYTCNNGVVTKRLLTDAADLHVYRVLYNDALDTEKLHFSTRHRIADAYAEIQYDLSISIYFTDGVNVLRRFNTAKNYYKRNVVYAPGLRGYPYSERGNAGGSEDIALPPNLRQQDVLTYDCRHDVTLLDNLMPYRLPLITLPPASDNNVPGNTRTYITQKNACITRNGKLLSGRYYVVMRYVDENNNYTDWSFPSPGVNITRPLSGSLKEGSASGLATGKSFKIRIYHLDARYDRLQLGILYYTGGAVPECYLSDYYQIEPSDFYLNYKEIEITGNYTGTFHVSEIQVPKIYPDTVETLAITDNRLFIANCKDTLLHNPLFKTLASQARVIWKIKEAEVNTFLTDISDTGYRNEVLQSLYTGYFRDQAYTFYIQFIFHSGKRSYLYPIGNTAHYLHQSPKGVLNYTGLLNAVDPVNRDKVNIGILYPQVVLNPVLLAGIKDIVQGYALYRGARQGDVVIAEGLVEMCPTLDNGKEFLQAKPRNAAESNNGAALLTHRRFSEQVSVLYWVGQRGLKANVLLFQNLKWTGSTDYNSNRNNANPEGHWLDAGQGLEYDAGRIDDGFTQCLTIFMPQPAILNTGIDTAEGDRIQFRYVLALSDAVDDDNTPGVVNQYVRNTINLITGVSSFTMSGLKNGEQCDIHRGIIRKYIHLYGFGLPALDQALNTPAVTLPDAMGFLPYDGNLSVRVGPFTFFNQAYVGVPCCTGDYFYPASEPNCTKAIFPYRGRTEDGIKDRWHKLILMNIGAGLYVYYKDPIDPLGLGTDIGKASRRPFNKRRLSIAAYLQQKGIMPYDNRDVFFTGYVPFSLQEEGSYVFNRQHVSEVFNGDCYIVQPFMPITVQPNLYDPLTVNEANIGIQAGFFIESSENLELRYISDASLYSYVPFDAAWDAKTGRYRNEARSYNTAFTSAYALTSNVIFNPQLLLSNVNPTVSGFSQESVFTQSTRIRHSPKKTLSNKTDTYRIFLPNDYTDEEADTGPIMRLIPLQNNLLVVCRSGLYIEPIGIPQLTAGVAGAGLQLTAGNVFQPRPVILSKKVGSAFKHSVVAASKGVYGIDTLSGYIWRVASDLQLLSQEKNVHRYVLTHYRSFVQENTAGQESMLVSGYDPYFKEVLFTAIRKEGNEIQFGDTLVFNELQDCFTDFRFDAARQPYFYLTYMAAGHACSTYNGQSHRLFRLNGGNTNTFFSDEGALQSQLQVIVNKFPIITKVFDNLTCYAEGYTDITHTRYHPFVFFTELRAENTHQDSDWQVIQQPEINLLSPTSDVFARNRERMWQVVLPRDRSRYNALITHPARLRDRWLRLSLRFDPYQVRVNSQDFAAVLEYSSFELFSLLIRFRPSFR
jgi:hypothetical protein